jgi:hypothetical protein
MKWFDLSFLEDLFLSLRLHWRLWRNYPNPAERKKVEKLMHEKAKELLDDAVRQEEWLASYEQRPPRSLQEVAEELRERISKE